ncbi:MAG TPA: GAF domain-containing protein [Ramlibacter sp.]|nr:GAF domain-containing protein [Ramlibacter sp.]
MAAPASSGHSFLAHASGECADKIRDFPWHRSALGAVENWPVSLRSIVTTLVECKLPMYLAWGPEFTQFYNDAYRPILGAKEAGALGGPAPQTWSEIWPTIGPMWEQVLAGESIGFEDFKLTINRYGYPEDCYFNFSYSPVRDESGAARGVLVTFAETTHRVVNERRLNFLDELSQKVRTASSPSEVMTLTAELLGRYLEVSRCAYAHVHADQDTFDLIGDYNSGVRSIVGQYKFTDFGQVVHELMVANEAYVNHDVDVDPRTATGDLGAYRLTQIQSVICVPLHKDGRFVAAMAVHQSTPRRWSPEEIELVRTVVDRCWDSLERLRSEVALREEARSLELLNVTGSALAAELDLDAVLQRVTDAATELTGARFGAFFYNGHDERGEALLLYTLSGAPRSSFEGFGHPRPTAIFGPTFRGESAIRIDDVLRDPRYAQWGPGMPAGHLPVRSYLAVPVIARSGDVIGGLFFGHPEVGIFTARSERLATGIAGQAAVAVDNARLYSESQRAASERSALLESERAARAEAERSSKVKDEFLATLSHELRTPLSAITGWVYILRNKLTASQPELVRGVEIIDRAARTQVQLIDDLLDMSKITAGKLRLEPKPVAPADFIQAALDVIAPTAGAAGVSITADLLPVGAVMGDAARLQQVVWNLLANAVKFTPMGGRVHVALSEENSTAIIRVTDTGTGIKPEFLPSMFARFQQADGSITRKFGGLGLGLSIVRTLVELHGGTVAASSKGEGHGSTFTVKLPVSTAHTAERAPHPVSTTSDVQLAGLRVLVVDDEADAREMLHRLLLECGADAQVASSAAEALEALPRYKPHILISDIGMPGTDGYDLLRQIRRLAAEHGGATPAIALTAFARPEDRDKAIAAGFTSHLTKPIVPYALLSEVKRLYT